MWTSAGAIRGWRRVICYMFLLAALGGASQTSASTDRTESGRPKAKRVRFASPVVQPRSDETSARDQSPTRAGQPAPQAYYTYSHTLYPQSTDSVRASTNTTEVHPSGEVRTTEVRQQYAFAWQPVGVMAGAPAHSFAGTIPWGAVPVRGQPGLYTFPSGPPVQNPMYPNTALRYYVAAVPSSGQPTDLSGSTSSSAATGAPESYTGVTHFQGFSNPGSTGPAWGPFSRPPLAPAFVQPRGRRNPDEIMEEVRAQEKLKNSRAVSPGRRQAVTDAITKGLAVVGAVVTAKKAAQGIQTLYRLARGTPRAQPPPPPYQ